MGKCRKNSSFNFGTGTGGKNCVRTVEDQGEITRKGQTDSSKIRNTYHRNNTNLSTGKC
jgi:hypothetical protein